MINEELNQLRLNRYDNRSPDSRPMHITRIPREPQLSNRMYEVADTEGHSGTIIVKPSLAESFKILWKIPNHFSLPNNSDYSLDSPVFKFMELRWFLRLYPNSQKGMVVSLCLIDNTAVDLKIACKVGLALWRQDIFLEDVGYITSFFSRTCKEKKFEDLPKRSELNAHLKDFTPQGLMAVLCHVFFYRNVILDLAASGFSQDFSRNRILTVESLGANVPGTSQTKIEKGTLSSKYARSQSLLITWTIPGFCSLTLSKTVGLDSPTFIFLEATWCLKLYYEDTEKNCCQRRVSLVRLHSLVSHQEFIVAFRFASITVDYFEYQRVCFNENHEMKVMCKCEGDADCNLSLQCHILHEDIKEKNANVRKMQLELNSCRQLSQDLKSLRLNGQDCDLTLMVKGKEFRVHRVILRVRSAVFASMLSHDTLEKSSGVVHIPDCDPQAMEQFLLYVYSGRVDVLDENNAFALYYIADKYDMMILRDQCRGFIKSSVSCSNICSVAQLALNHCDDILLKLSKEFIGNNEDEIVASTEWTRFVKQNPSAVKQLYSGTTGKMTRSKAKKLKKN